MLAIMKKKKKRKLGWEYPKTWVGIFQVGVFWLRIFQRINYQGGVWLVEICRIEILRVGVFLIPKKIYPKNSQVYMHWNWSSSEKYSFFKPITSVFNPLPIITFSYGTEIFPHPSVRLTGHISPLIGYTEM